MDDLYALPMADLQRLYRLYKYKGRKYSSGKSQRVRAVMKDRQRLDYIARNAHNTIPHPAPV